MYFALILLLGLVVGILVGFMGIGGGVVFVPLMVHLLHFDQHTAQGTSLFMQLPPLGLGALLLYRRKGQADLRVGSICAVGFLIGGFFGSKIAIALPSAILTRFFGLFLMAVAVWEWRRGTAANAAPEAISPTSHLQNFFILLVATWVGILGGLFGVGGGTMLVPALVFVFGFGQHRAQGTSLVALVPPTGLLAFINYARAHQVDWTVGLLIMPGVFMGAMAGTRIAQELSPERMRRAFAVLMFAIGTWEVVSSWHR
jgi:uncharacterized membrane protein YfcA